MTTSNEILEEWQRIKDEIPENQRSRSLQVRSVTDYIISKNKEGIVQYRLYDEVRNFFRVVGSHETTATGSEMDVTDAFNYLLDTKKITYKQEGDFTIFCPV
ncbi:hypothetical protein KBX73_14870 [Acetobacter persici]|uniref:hypothetical protein n=1 Tax=Acetobacter persici TaxID=1076596 RepID=UPI0020CD637C|nr:hypothetical protein [Acetobacter persici]MCP9321026.1 hypothetical protein [Acetobacter persici]